MAVGAAASERTLEFTPTWALATVSTVFVLTSLVVERSLHALGHVRRSCILPLILHGSWLITAVISILVALELFEEESLEGTVTGHCKFYDCII
jgi:hypothetical protein